MFSLSSSDAASSCSSACRSAPLPFSMSPMVESAARIVSCTSLLSTSTLTLEASPPVWQRGARPWALLIVKRRAGVECVVVA
eukprot:1248220-Prymnesium_polylepis.1